MAKDGAYVTDRYGQLRAHPGVAVERDSKTLAARLFRELALDPRPPLEDDQQGITTKRGKQWTAKRVRDTVENDVYVGDKGYPKLIERDRWQRIQDGLKRMDPAAVHRRKGGRSPAHDSFILRGVLRAHARPHAGPRPGLHLPRRPPGRGHLRRAPRPRRADRAPRARPPVHVHRLGRELDHRAGRPARG